jgi:hypothetical protein
MREKIVVDLIIVGIFAFLSLLHPIIVGESTLFK